MDGPPSLFQKYIVTACGRQKGLERLNRVIRRRTRVAVLFPNTASCLYLVTAIVMEISEELHTGRIYIRLDDDV